MTQQHSDEYRRLVARLKDARVRARVSQEVLAERIGLDQSWVSKVERGVRRLDVIEFIKIAHAIGCDYRELLDPASEELMEAGKSIS